MLVFLDEFSFFSLLAALARPLAGCSPNIAYPDQENSE
jgi:hypothetical protein